MLATKSCSLITQTGLLIGGLLPTVPRFSQNVGCLETNRSVDHHAVATALATGTIAWGSRSPPHDTNCRSGPRFAQMLWNKICEVLSCPFWVTSKSPTPVMIARQPYARTLTLLRLIVR